MTTKTLLVTQADPTWTASIIVNSFTEFLETLEHLGAWGILATDANLTVISWNRWLEKHSGKPSKEVVGRRLVEVYPELLDRGLDRYFRLALEGQSSLLSQRFHGYLLPMPPTVANSDMSFMQQTSRVSPLIEDGRNSGTLTLIEDVTERVATELELREQAKRLEDANRHKDEFLAMLAHELRNPLAPIRNGIRLLDMIPSDAQEGRETLAMLERQVTHMSRLVDDLMDVSRIVRGKVLLRHERCDVVAVVRDVTQDYRTILLDNGIELSTEFPTDPCWVTGDCVRLAQIISNLLQNSSKFTNRGGAVEVHLERQQRHNNVVIRVSDTGIGMNLATRQSVFDAFSQAESTLERNKGGLGLGLALVKGLTELHGGNVQAFSPGLGKGSTFTVTLPISESVPARNAATQGPQIAVQRIKNILIVEDNRDAASSLKALIRTLGFEVTLAYSGSDGIEAARRINPEVILCDIGLPVVNGFDVAKVLRGDVGTRESLLIAQSGYGQEDDIRQSREAGFDFHLIKPLDFAELKRILLTRNGGT